MATLSTQFSKTFRFGEAIQRLCEESLRENTKQNKKKNSHFDYAPNPKNGFHIHVFDIEHRIGWLHLSTYS